MLGMIIKQKREEIGISQEALAKGICAVSYLSKIENEQVIGSEQIMSALFNKLEIEYVVDIDVIARFKSEYIKWLDLLTYEDDLEEIYSVDMYHLANRMINSSEIINALFYKSFYENRYEMDTFDIKQLKGFAANMDSTQLVLLALIESYYNHNKGKLKQAIDVLNRTLIYDTVGLIRCQLVRLYFLSGMYSEAIEEGKRALVICAENGRLNSMHMITLLIAYSYSNLFDEENMIKYYNLSDKYTKYLKRPLSVEEDYNIGASYLTLGKYELAQTYLEKAMNNRTNLDIVRQKLGFVYALLGKSDDALNQVDILKKSNEVLYQKSAVIIELIATDSKYLESKRYLDLLEESYEYVLSFSHHGYSQFFALLLKEAYIANRMYKKALEITEKFKFS